MDKYLIIEELQRREFEGRAQNREKIRRMSTRELEKELEKETSK